ncbi:Stress responsive alpha-beta barrel domain protein [Coraliomargarita akajimensis DSM 45221]|uniref:Stress responsive alpha-beta barrel domain protein n=2 Tax=Coraliomargarita TaxID=442430 RepID=D5EKI3_CORAD|nr:Dabb family protein [Coraliomargarita akajimensis]ADE53064.1 Stress responsive alpha-beta barrel domain protein [Coraliomargarita akajimensis DSM 45221]
MKFHIGLLLLLLCLLRPTLSAQPNQGESFSPNFTHVVYFWLKNPNNAADRERFEQSIKLFMQDSKYAQTRFVGVAPKASRDVVDDSFTYSLILSFESAEAQAKYQEEVAHLRFVEECKDLWEKVIVYDAIPLK